MKVGFSIWLATKTRWAHLTKAIDMHVMPRVGEFIKFRNEKTGDYFAFKITEVTYREDSAIEVSTELLGNIDDRMYSFDDEHEFDEYVDSYLGQGWTCERGIGPNSRYASRHASADDA